MFGSATQWLELSHQAAERVGKKTIDSLLIAKAFVEYKSNNVPKALKFIQEEAHENLIQKEFQSMSVSKRHRGAKRKFDCEVHSN